MHRARLLIGIAFAFSISSVTTTFAQQSVPAQGPLVVETIQNGWLFAPDVRAIVGAGSATLPLPVTEVIDPKILASSTSRSPRRLRGGLTLIDPTATIAVRDDFFVAEPKLNLLVNVARGQRIVLGVGYRAVGSAPYLGDALNGLSGSVE